jgi:hypothetical protein
MNRMQVQLTDGQLAALRRISAHSGISISELIRKGIDRYLADTCAGEPESRIERAIRVAGMFSSGLSDVSADHDRHLSEAFDQQ